MVDEMFLQKCAQYQGSEYKGVNEDGKLYNPSSKAKSF